MQCIAGCIVHDRRQYNLCFYVFVLVVRALTEVSLWWTQVFLKHGKRISLAFVFSQVSIDIVYYLIQNLFTVDIEILVHV